LFLTNRLTRRVVSIFVFCVSFLPWINTLLFQHPYVLIVSCVYCIFTPPTSLHVSHLHIPRIPSFSCNSHLPVPSHFPQRPSIGASLSLTSSTSVVSPVAIASPRLHVSASYTTTKHICLPHRPRFTRLTYHHVPCVPCVSCICLTPCVSQVSCSPNPDVPHASSVFYTSHISAAYHVSPTSCRVSTLVQSL